MADTILRCGSKGHPDPEGPEGGSAFAFAERYNSGRRVFEASGHRAVSRGCHNESVLVRNMALIEGGRDGGNALSPVWRVTT